MCAAASAAPNREARDCASAGIPSPTIAMVPALCTVSPLTLERPARSSCSASGERQILPEQTVRIENVMFGGSSSGCRVVGVEDLVKIVGHAVGVIAVPVAVGALRGQHRHDDAKRRLPMDSSARTAPANSCFLVEPEAATRITPPASLDTTAASVTRRSGGVDEHVVELLCERHEERGHRGRTEQLARVRRDPPAGST